MTGRFERFDARPGGAYRIVLTYADASTARDKATVDSDSVEAHFLEIVAGRRIVQSVDFVSDQPGYGGTMTMTWEVAPADNGTRADNVPAEISAEDHDAGLLFRWQVSPHTSNGKQRRAQPAPALRHLPSSSHSGRNATSRSDTPSVAALQTRNSATSAVHSSGPETPHDADRRRPESRHLPFD